MGVYLTTLIPTQMSLDRRRECSRGMGSGQAKTLQPSRGGVCHGLLSYEERFCAPLSPLSTWSMGKRLPALALMSRSDEPVLMTKWAAIHGRPSSFDPGRNVSVSVRLQAERRRYGNPAW